MKVSDRIQNLLKARAEGLEEPDEIRRIRNKLHLTQEQAGDLIGGGPRAFQKYEAGDLQPSRAISSALTLLDNDPSALALLKRRRRKTQPKHMIRLVPKGYLKANCPAVPHKLCRDAVGSTDRSPELAPELDPTLRRVGGRAPTPWLGR